ncbi:hypothetical protein F4806DRAFT_135555 [Annulohypoxylon nitens]|nr:hypothetical protein F4806DRAFT_135555 [Annulohypoxylon nitens]
MLMHIPRRWKVWWYRPRHTTVDGRQGARNILVPSRSGPSYQATLEAASELTAKGVRLATSNCDVRSINSLSALLHNCATSIPAIKECINAAMVLQVRIFTSYILLPWGPLCFPFDKFLHTR